MKKEFEEKGELKITFHDIPELPHDHPFYTDGVVYVRGLNNEELKSLKRNKEKLPKRLKSKNIRKILGSQKPIKVGLDLNNPLNLIDGKKLLRVIKEGGEEYE